MNTDKHTPLNWEANGVETLYNDIGVWIPFEDGRKGGYFKRICRVDYGFENTHNNISLEESKANAEMIVKAVNNYPKLVEALEAFVEYLDSDLSEAETILKNRAELLLSELK